jgi:hypothetical protein
MVKQTGWAAHVLQLPIIDGQYLDVDHDQNTVPPLFFVGLLLGAFCGNDVANDFHY